MPLEESAGPYGKERQPGVNAFDRITLGTINSFARRSPELDAFVEWVDEYELMKGGLILAVVWGFWFLQRGDVARCRQALVGAVLAGFGAILVGRLSGYAFPFRPRPIHDAAAHFIPPYGARGYGLELWSSFPSQHALFYSALGFGMFYVSPLFATLILIHTLVFIALPRVYLGLHYPSDIVGGFVIGGLVAWTMNRPALRDRLASPLLRWQERHAGVFYALFFLVSLQLATMFKGAISLLRLIVNGPTVE